MWLREYTAGRQDHLRLKSNWIMILTGTDSPPRFPGSKRHSRAVEMAISSRPCFGSRDWRTVTSVTVPSGITVPASIKEFPDDLWSSLRAPSKVPVMTVLEPSNAVLAALQILSARNPRLYAHVRAEIEARTVNTIMV